MYIIEIKSVQKDPKKIEKFEDLRKVKLNPNSPTDPGQNYYIHKLPKFHSFMKGKTYRYSDYKMDLFNLLCSCENQKLKREKYKGRDVRLLCKHLYYKILKTSVAKELDSLSLELMKNAVLWGEKHLYRYRYMEQDIILGFKEGIEWVNVYAKNKFNPKEHYRYSFNVMSNRWSYDNEPEYGHLIPDLISRVIKHNLIFEHQYQNKMH